MKILKPLVLVVLDGWGEWSTKIGNPVAYANLPTIGKLNKYYPKLLLEASGIAVGLPWGVVGNSEVGHQTIGSGQIIYHYLPTITSAIRSDAFFRNQVLLNAIAWTKKYNSRLHFLGLVSDGGVHSHIDHLVGLLKLAKEQGVPKVFIHAVTDGRDTSPKSADKYLKIILEKTKQIGVGIIVSIAGRYYAMDRNKNWDRTEKAFLAYTKGVGIKEQNPQRAIENQYNRKITDEYIEPVVMVDNQNKPVGLVEDNDAIVCFNFRGDRSRQITKAFVMPNFDKFKKAKQPHNIKFVCFAQYEEGLPVDIVFPPHKITTRVAEILSKSNKKQLRIAETEKFAHVTYFFNGGIGDPFVGEDRIFVPSKNVRSYAEDPRMSAYEITKKLLKAIIEKDYDFVLVNYANSDMVGHTGDFKAGIKAVEVVDNCLQQLMATVLKKGGCLIITADHGNIEEMINLETGEIDTKHSINPVPCWLVAPDNQRAESIVDRTSFGTKGMIADIAPTILELLKIRIPKDMVGISLLDKFK